MVQESARCAELAAIMTRYPQVLINFRRTQDAAARVVHRRGASRGEKPWAKTAACWSRYSARQLQARVMIEGPTSTEPSAAYAEEIVRP